MSSAGFVKGPSKLRSSREDVKSLAGDLRKAVRGEVRFDGGSRALYATGAANWRQIPVGIVIPRDKEDVLTTLLLCNRYQVPVLSRGGGTGLAGQTTNVAVIIDFSKYLNRLLSLDVENRCAVVEPGLILDHLRNRAEQHHLTFGPDPSTHDHCTLGGMVGNNSCGTHSVMAGKTSDNVEELEICTYSGLRMRVGPMDDATLEKAIAQGGETGSIYSRLRSLRDRYAKLIRAKYPNIPRRVSGYNLDELLPENGFNVARALVGSEGTCVTVLEARLRLVHSPPCRSLVVLGYEDIYIAADHVPEILESHPLACEAIDDVLIENLRRKGMHSGDLQFLPKGHGWLLLEFGGESREESDHYANDLIKHLQIPGAPESRLYDNREEEDLIWKIREAGLGATALVPGEPATWEGWEDSAVAPEKLGQYLREFRKLLNEFGYRCALYGHFGQGCLHTRIEFDLETREGINKYHSFTSAAADLVVGLGGSLSGEHGDGQSRASFLPKMFGDELMRGFAEFKSIWDPTGHMNPHKVVSAYSNIDNLRLGTEYHPPHLKTYFKFPEDNGDFAAATLRCVGVGKCRRTDGGVMCPSFMATREEMHSTRGRARLLFEMLRGDPLTEGWQSEPVRQALDLCLACKGCKGECPVNVDMATYKAEFLSHYYERHFRPMAAHSMGRINRWARLASLMPSLANLTTQTPGISALLKWIGGIAPSRSMPPFTRQTFRSWFANRDGIRSDGPRVMLWPDTFHNYFHPEIARAATEVLEHAGYSVIIPSRVLCCGRPLYDFGFLRPARRYLQSVLNELAPQLREGTFIVGLEPSCLSVLRDEVKNMFPQDRDAFRLTRQAVTLSDFLERHAAGYTPPKFAGRRALIQAHCHHKSVLGFDCEKSLLKKMEIEFEEPEPGCCGMAGSFGFERSHYDISLRIGERALLPAVRKEADDSLLIADGFSCRTQIEQGTGKRPMHIAQLIRMGIEQGRIL
jgi:FAD/FMN-containing dehydrogenase/Fe-S oxidoreductase